MHDITFFTSRVGSFIKRGSTDVFIADHDTAMKLYAVQDEKKGYVFSAPVRVSVAEDSLCTACEG